MRIVPLAALILLPAITAVPARAADDRPAVVVAVKSLDGLIADAKYVAGLAGKDNEAAQIEGLARMVLGKGLKAIDTKKPIGLYARVNADDPQMSEAVVLVPVADEDALIDVIKKQNNLTLTDKDADGVYKVTPASLPVPIYFRFADKYAYVTAQNKDAIAKDRLIAPSKLLPAETTSLLSLTIHGDAIPDKYKDMAITSLTQGLTQAKQQEQPGETPALKAFRLAAIDEAESLFESVIKDGADLTVSIDVDKNAGELSASATFTGRPGSPLAKDISELAAKKSLAAALVGTDSAANAIIDVTVPEKVRQAAAELFIDGMKQGLAQTPNGEQLSDAFIKAARPTLEAGQLDAGFDLRGPDAKGHFTLVAGLKVQKGNDVEKLLRDLVKQAPAQDQNKLKLDVAKVGGVSIHQVIPDANQPMDEGVKKLLGDNPEIYFAIRNDAILISAGPDALAALKEAATAKPATGPMLQWEVSVSRVAPLLAEQNPAAPDIAKKVFADGKKDKVRVALQGGKALTLKISMDAPLISFASQLEEAKNK